MRIDEFFPDGEWKSSEEYVITCPFCGDNPTHNHCYVNVVKKKFYCHYCGACGSVSRLIKKAGFPKTSLLDKSKTKRAVGRIDFSKYPLVTGEKGVMDALALTYLKDRGLEIGDVYNYDIRYSERGQFYGRVLFPVYEEGKVVCFVGRSFLSMVKPKYLFPKKGQTLLTSSEVIFNYDKALSKKVDACAIVEGIFDSISVEKKIGLLSLAIMRNRISRVQLLKLLRLSKNIEFFVIMDSDSNRETIGLVRQLWERGRKVKAVFLPSGDPDSLSKEKLAQSILSAKGYSVLLEREIILRNRLVSRRGRHQSMR